MRREPIILDGNTIVPRQVLAERVTILAEHGQTGSYEVTVHDGLEALDRRLTSILGMKPFMSWTERSTSIAAARRRN